MRPLNPQLNCGGLHPEVKVKLDGGQKKITRSLHFIPTVKLRFGGEGWNAVEEKKDERSSNEVLESASILINSTIFFSLSFFLFTSFT
ncbi:hypothetical protein CEP54_012849 [Fusarium duplospermum]|uniref:Uncharacterized protein n=1 Tax=Fusarium duplospermum TaxID=1325734 RepID=A0A428P6A8_9HYPO|nr:hypothetical protein CEP54_012849 [Fusarium duplospermum]